MSYEKAMRHTGRKSRKQANNHFGFTTLGSNERRRNPVLGAVWYEPGMEQERKAFIDAWHLKTAEMQKLNPNLVIVD